MKQSQLIARLIQTCEVVQEKAIAASRLPADRLTQRPSPNSWNALECFEHLNLYVDIYNDFFKESLQNAPLLGKDYDIKRGYWGNRFIKWMQPTENGIKKMNTFKSKNPIHQKINKEVIHHFIKANQLTIDYLKEAKPKDIQRAKCRLAIPLLKLKLSDAFQFLIAHNERHMLQIQHATA